MAPSQGRRYGRWCTLVSRSHGRARRVGIGLLGLGATFVTIAASFLLPMFFAIRRLLRGIGQWRRAHGSRAIAGGLSPSFDRGTGPLGIGHQIKAGNRADAGCDADGWAACHLMLRSELNALN